jgi:hypothetical protein
MLQGMQCLMLRQEHEEGQETAFQVADSQPGARCTACHALRSRVHHRQVQADGECASMLIHVPENGDPFVAVAALLCAEGSCA